MPRLELRRVVGGSSTAVHVDLVDVLLESLLPLEASDVAGSELVFDDSVLGDDCLVSLAAVSPFVALQEENERGVKITYHHPGLVRSTVMLLVPGLRAGAVD